MLKQHELSKSIHKRTADEVEQVLLEKKNNKIIENQDYEFLIDILHKCPQHAMNIYTWATLCNKKGLLFQPILEKSTNTIKYISKNKDLSFDQGSIHHKLIIGDNYDALNNLLITHREKIDIIYIDPPYGCNDMGEFADTNYENNLSRDNLLSMLKPRLLLAKQLLTKNGVIFCSIDDKNHAYVRCLFDEIFGEDKFLENFIIIKNSGGSLSKTTLTRHEHCLMYSKNIINQNDNTIFLIKKPGFESVNKLITDCKNKKMSIRETQIELSKFYKLHEELKGIKLYKNIDQNWKVYQELPITAPNNQFYDVIHPKTGNPVKKPARGWSWKKETMEEMIREGIVVFGEDETTGLRQKMFLDEAEFEHKRSTLNLDQSEGNKILESIMNKVNVFDNPKPLTLLNYLLSNSNKNSIVLDFFAGSGTTGHSVLQTNSLDNGFRQFILCTNNEINDNFPNGIAYDVTSERMRRIMTGKTSNNKKDFPWTKNNKSYGDSLDIYDIKEIKNSDKSIFKTINPIDYGLNLNDNKKRDWICENFEITCKELEK